MATTNWFGWVLEINFPDTSDDDLHLYDHLLDNRVVSPTTLEYLTIDAVVGDVIGDTDGDDFSSSGVAGQTGAVIYSGGTSNIGEMELDENSARGTITYDGHTMDTRFYRFALENGDVVVTLSNYFTDLIIATVGDTAFDPTKVSFIQLGIGGEGPGNDQVTAGTVSNFGPLCFAAGTPILTDRGEIPVEALKVGALVQTLDHGLQPVRWIGKATHRAAELRADPKLSPIRIQAGALADGLPMTDLVVSRQHRILLRSKIAGRMFGVEEVLTQAKNLLPAAGVSMVEGAAPVTYLHLLLDTHEVIFAAGAPAESLLLGEQTYAALKPYARSAVRALGSGNGAPGSSAVPARRLIEEGGRIKTLIARSQKNKRCLIDAPIQSGAAARAIARAHISRIRDRAQAA